VHVCFLLQTKISYVNVYGDNSSLLYYYIDVEKYYVFTNAHPNHSPTRYIHNIITYVYSSYHYISKYIDL